MMIYALCRHARENGSYTGSAAELVPDATPPGRRRSTRAAPLDLIFSIMPPMMFARADARRYAVDACHAAFYDAL